MSRSVTFNGITMFRPGGITRVNADALAQIGLLSNAIVGLIGESEGGEPNVVITIDDPALAKTDLVGGPLANAIRIAFDPTTDPRVPGGAFRCQCMRVNQGTQSTVTLYGREVRDTAAAGSTTLIINLTTGGLVASAHIGNVLRIGTEERTITANAAGTVTVSPAFSTAPTVGQTVDIMAPKVTVTSLDYGSHTTRLKQEFEPGSSSGSSWTTAYDTKSQTSDNLGAKSYLDVEYVGQNIQVILASGTSTAGGASTLTDGAAAWGTNAFQNLFVKASGGGIGATPNLRKIASNTGTQLTVTNAWSNPAAGAETYSVRKGKIHSGTATAGAASTINLEAAINLAANELAGMVIVLTGGTGSGQRRTITSNAAGTSPLVTVDTAWTTQPVSGTTYEIRYVTKAKASIVGTAGKATTFKTNIAYDGGAAADDLSIAFTSTMTIKDLVNKINAYSSYSAAVPNGINGLLLMKEFDFDAGATDVEIRNDKSAVTTAAFPPTDPQTTWHNHFRRDAQDVVDDVTARNQYVEFVRASGVSQGAGSGKPEYTGGAVGVVGDTYKYLTGGTRGISANSDWQNGLDELAKIRVNHLVALISQDLTNEGFGSTATFSSVAAQMSSHLDYCNGAGKSERGGYMGMKGTRAQIIAMANQLNHPDIQLCGQKITVLDVTSTLVEMDEWAMAVAAAGMRAGMDEVGEPLTHKYIRTADLTQDVGWDPLEVTDANKLIENGILFAENIKGKGIRFVRDLTTYITDDNLAYAEGSVRDVVRYVSYGLRTYLEDRFTGRKAKPSNATAIKDTAAEFLEQCRSQNIIVDSTNPDTGATVHAFYNLRVKISGDIATIRVSVFPVVGINFQLNDIYLQLPTQAAA